MWRTTLSITLVLGFAAPAMAIDKLDSRAQNCASVHAILGRDRQAILRFPSRDGRVTLYDRYVSTPAQCGPGQYGIRVSIPAADGACPVVSCRPLNDFAP